MSQAREITIPTISNDGRGPSYFGQRHETLSGDITRQLSEQIDAVNFRLRHSEYYSSDYHVAGDPTLLIVLSGSIRIDLQNGDSKTFTQGDLYIAEDYLESGVTFNPTLHGHRAVMTENMPYKAVHIKLSKRS
jgi:hypothetical protein